VATSVTERPAPTAGRRRAEKVRTRTNRVPYLLLLGAGTALAGVAWAFLVRAAIDFGRAAPHGGGVGWALTVGATVGATACLLLMFALIARAGTALGLRLRNDYQPRRSAGTRRAR
jgi:hypothetical protein